MEKSFSRRAILGALLSSAAAPALANAPLTSPRPEDRPARVRKAAIGGADRLIAEARLGGKVSFAVADARSGLVLEARDGALAQPPASVTKAVTAAYALNRLGPAHRFRTRLIATGPIRDGRIDGDLILAGGGDPTLDTDILGRLASELKATGVRAVRGKFRIYAGALPYVRKIDPDQLDHVGYNPSISGLNLNYNRVHFEWKRSANGYQVTLDARAKNFVPRVTTARMRIVDRELPVYTYKNGGGVDDWTVARKALGKGGARWLPVRNPAVYTGQVFQTLARSHGIVLETPVTAKSLPQGNVLAEHISPPLAELARTMLKFSTNLTAEVLGLSASGSKSGLPGSARAMSGWAGKALGMSRAKFVDHSGLGEDSRVSAQDMVKALVKLGPGGQVAGLLKIVPMRGADGKIDKAHPIRVRAKTGTLNFVSALAGFMTAPDGTELAFAIFTSDLPRRRAAKRAGDEVPGGARGWTKRSRRLQQQLIERWGALYGR